MAEVEVCYEDKTAKLPLVVVSGNLPSLLGRDWIDKLNINITSVNKVESPPKPQGKLTPLLSKYSSLFDGEPGTMVGIKAKLHVDPTVQPRFLRERPVSHAYREAVEKEIDRLVASGTIAPVEYSEWATPVVPIAKPDGTVRICGDYKLTVNKASKLAHYPLPRMEDIHLRLAGGTTFTELDLSHAYEQVPLDEAAQALCTINTHRGLFRYQRLPYGVSSSPAVFQRAIEGLLKDMPGVAVYLDNIVLTGKTEEEHLQRLETVFKRLDKAGLKLKEKKCQFFKDNLTCMGQNISKQGISPVPAKVEAIKQAPAPTNMTELKSFLGLLNFYRKHLPSASTVLAPLYRLLKKDVTWQWNDSEEEAFNKAKELLQADSLLVHYDPDKPIIVSCDASPYGVGGVISHKMPDNSEKPIAFTSRTMSDAEKRYSQLDKEALAIVFVIKKFHTYLHGRFFTLTTDHKPLLGLFGPNRGIPAMASARMQRWLLTTEAYEFNLVHRSGKNNGNADALSRLPCKSVENEPPLPGEVVNLLAHIDNAVIRVCELRKMTRQDPVLSHVLLYVQQGWPYQVDEPELKPFFVRKEELSCQDGCILWGSRVVVPSAARSRVISLVHEAHPGITRMKNLARRYVWWPKVDENLEHKAKTCIQCQMHQNNPTQAPLHPWIFPTKPWERIHIDYAGPFQNKMFLITVDAHSKWIDVQIVPSATTATTIECLRRQFCTHGLPRCLVSDNASVFTSSEFKEFLHMNGIQHTTSAPYHPSTNGLAEKAVQTFKQAMRKQHSGSVETKISRFLLQYRITPHSTTGETPCKLLMGRELRSHLSLMHPQLSSKVQDAQLRQKMHHDKSAAKTAKKLEEGDDVYIKDYAGKTKWQPGVLKKQTGPVSAEVQLKSGEVRRRHWDQLRPRSVVAEVAEKETLLYDEVTVPEPEVLLPEPQPEVTSDVTITAEDVVPADTAVTPAPAINPANTERRYPKRHRKPPNYLDAYVKK